MLEETPTAVAARWSESFSSALVRNDIPAAMDFFLEESYWRDLLTFTWNIETMEGRDAIAAMLRTTLSGTRPRNWRVQGDGTSDGTVIEAWFTFETEVARGEGTLRLREGQRWTINMIAASMPFALLAEGQKKLHDTIRARDADFYERLGASGFALDFGDDETGLMMKAYRTGSGYYIDVGACKLIVNGDIEVKSGVEISCFTPTGLRFKNDEELAADAVIFCTGYHSMHEVVAQIVSREVADRIGPCWGLGSGVRGDPGPWEGEPRNMWKPTAQEALWFHGGNLALSRYYSKHVALQLKARMEGLSTPVYRAPKRNDGPGRVGRHHEEGA